MNKLLFEYQLISRFRGELMGIGIIGVLLAHLFGLTTISYSSYIIKTGHFIMMVVFTEGFLFLSGFGLYYSLHKNANIGAFYHRRLLRLYIPYILMSVPFFIFFMIENKIGWTDFALDVTTLFFWVEGNNYGLWYIAMSVILYLMAPFVFLFCDSKRGVINIIFLIVGSFALNMIVSELTPEYWNKVNIGLSKVPFFFLGMLIGKLSSQRKSLSVQGG